MTSPFKFLDPYTLQDREVFFGRDKEVDTLYNLLYSTPLVLVHGLSGTGKTSLVQCGLASRYEGPEWHPFFIRRSRKDINSALREELQEALPSQPIGDDIPAFIRQVVETYYSPVYLIFDQLEELFILGTQQERKAFANNLKAILDSELSCKVLLVIREEYLGRLYDFEQKIPYLFDFRLRVEPMNMTRVREVLQRSFAAFNISLEPPAENRLDEIIENVSGERSGIELPYLQVYLDSLWREDFNRSYPNGIKTLTENWPELELTRQEIQDFGPIAGVLQRYLEQQEGLIQQKLKEKYLNEAIEPKIIRNILDVFVTEEGTKRPVPFQLVQEQLIIPPRILKNFPIENPILTDCIQALERSRILRSREGSYELAHDSLASLIDEERSEEEKRFNRIRHEIRVLFQTGQFLNQRLLTSYADDFDKLALKEELMKFIEQSRENLRNQQREKEKAKERELQLIQEKFSAERKARRRQQHLSFFITLIALIAIVAAVWAGTQRNLVKGTNIKLTREIMERHISTARSLKNQGDYTAAIAQMDTAGKYAGMDQDISRLKKLKQNWQLQGLIVNKGDSLFNQGDFLLALVQYDSAYLIEPDALVENKRNQTMQKIEQKFNELHKSAEDIIRYGGCKHAKKYLFEALQLENALRQGGDEKMQLDIERVRSMLESCNQ